MCRRWRTSPAQAYTFLLNMDGRGEELFSSQYFDLLHRFAFGGVTAITDEESVAHKAE